MEILIAIIILAVGAVWYYNAQANKVIAKEDAAPEPAPVEAGKPADEIVEAPAVTPTVKPRAKKAAPAAIKAKPARAAPKTTTAAKPKTTRTKKS